MAPKVSDPSNVADMFKHDVEPTPRSEDGENNTSSTTARSERRLPLPWGTTISPRLTRLLVTCIVCLTTLYFSDSSLATSYKARFGVSASPSTPRLDLSKGFSSAQKLRRRDGSIDICKRWAGQSAVVNGTLYYYGGRSSTSADQTADTWNNNFLTLDLTKSWSVSAPAMKSLPAPSGPPAVSLGSLWSSAHGLYLYGGEYSDSPVTTPDPFSLWSYDIASSSWTQHSRPISVDSNDAIQRAAEGAGISLPHLGRGFYFGGHLDGYTVQGWPQSAPRLYLESLIEYTMPGYQNPSLPSGSTTAGSDGVFRNITAVNAGFPERADGVLVYVPGYSSDGIILSLAGGTNQSFTQLNVIDVYDVATSSWYKQATSGPTPGIRVNPCAVALSAADGSSTEIYLYGGQNLIPAGQQTQYDDMWILTIPSFTWIQVDTNNQSTPPARAGHTCHVWNSQMVVVGGYVGQELSCDSPGIYVFNTSALTWQNQYTVSDQQDGGDADSDDFNRQPSQQDDPSALQGSYGYLVPDVVQAAIGGGAIGGATVTQASQSASGGPFATGSPQTYTVTSTGTGAKTTQTGTTGTRGGDGHDDSNGSEIGAIVAGVIAGLLFLLALYLGFCIWLYRKQIRRYRDHAAILQHAQLTGGIAKLDGRRSHGSSHPSSRSGGGNSGGLTGGMIGGGGPTFGGSRAEKTNGPGRTAAGTGPYMGVNTAASSTEDLLQDYEPNFWGVVLSPRRSLRVVNRD